MTDWKTIDSAPRDETHIIGWDGKIMTVIEWDLYYWALVVAGSYAEDDAFYPTHWMPLPDPPE